VSETAQIELRSGRVEAPATGIAPRSAARSVDATSASAPVHSGAASAITTARASSNSASMM